MSEPVLHSAAAPSPPPFHPAQAATQLQNETRPKEETPASPSTFLKPAFKPSPIVTRAATRTKRAFKVIIIGDAGVGKTCLSFRFCNGRFPERTEATIGVDFRERSVNIDGELLRIQLWDTAGQERFRQSMVAHYYRNVSAVVFVYDLSCPKSFANLVGWIKEARSQVTIVEGEELPMLLIGNKCDVEGAKVATQEAQAFADANDLPLFETSAKADSQADHVESIFMTLVHKLKDCKGMHVQSEEERARRSEAEGGGARILRAADLAKDGVATEEPGWCC